MCQLTHKWFPNLPHIVLPMVFYHSVHDCDWASCGQDWQVVFRYNGVRWAQTSRQLLTQRCWNLSCALKLCVFISVCENYDYSSVFFCFDMLAITCLRPFEHLLLHLSTYSWNQRLKDLNIKGLAQALLAYWQVLLAMQFRLWDYILALLTLQ